MDDIADHSQSTVPLGASSVIEGQPATASDIKLHAAINIDNAITDTELAAIQLNYSSADARCANTEYRKGAHVDSTDNGNPAATTMIAVPATLMTMLPETFSLEDTATLYFAGSHFHAGSILHQDRNTNINSDNIHPSASGSLGDQEQRDKSTGISPPPEGNCTSD
ncbi:hypothetical protein GALMADRAFT_210633 [Galerina marginata CBS 339.88]|uniref:Uncharacterized protein n=1 Tax=Galerina marginata (strain CBS 339.88) TaxID=685588 RepID=A0A067TCM8_GALM3|nr:hypothetical protein GALMADRAFT_210633 [Galerina marginata CBS 339.88]